MSDELFPPDALTREELARVVHSSSDLVVLLDARRAIVYASGSVCANTGWRRDELLGRKISVLFPPAARLASAGRIFGGTRKSGKWEGELSLQGKSGGPFTVRASVAALPEASSASYLLTAEVVTYKKLLARKELFSASSIRAIVDAAADGIFVCDHAGQIRFCNKTLAGMLGTRIEEIVGAKPPYRWCAAAELRRAMKIFKKEGALRNFTMLWEREGGAPFSVSMSFAPVAGSGFVATVRDITGVQYAEELRRGSEQMRRLLTAVRNKSERLTTLQLVNSLVLRNADISNVFRAVTAGVRKLVPHDLAGIYVHDPSREAFMPHTLSRQTAFSRRLAKFPLPLGEGIVGAAAISGKTVCVNNAQLDPRSTYPAGVKPPVEHFIAVPLKGRDSIFGVIVVARHRDPGFIEEDMHIVQSFADAAAVALENTRLYYELTKADPPVRGAGARRRGTGSRRRNAGEHETPAVPERTTQES